MTPPVHVEPPALPTVNPASAAPGGPDGSLLGFCPYLEVAGGRWRHATPSRDHRCTALQPPAPLSADKQRRLCLAADHVSCSTFVLAASARRAWAGSAAPEADGLPGLPEAAANRWSIPRTTPVVSSLAGHTAMLEWARRRGLGQLSLVGLLVVAFAAIAVSRLPGDGSSGALLVPTPGPVAPPTAAPTVAPPSPTATFAPTPVPTPSPTDAPTIAPTPGALTHKVVSGDTLSALATRFGTTVKAIQQLNGLTGTVIRVGQVLKIPPPPGSPAPSPSA